MEENATFMQICKFYFKYNGFENHLFTFIRSILEKSAVVWHSSLTKKNRQTLERVQKAAVKIILKNRYTNYKEGLNYLKMDNLDERRRQLCLKFAKNCLKIEKVKGMFTKKINLHNMKTRKQNYFEERRIRTKRYQKSTIPYLTKLLNLDMEDKKQMMV